MSKVTVFAKTLRLKGNSKTLNLAEKHNRRLIAQEIGGYGGIDGRRTSLNHELIKLNGASYEKIAIDILRSKGLDLDHFSYKKKNRGYAVELVFSVTSGHECDFNAMYADSLDWLKSYYQECSVIHAIVHHDEDTPHMHVILVPLVNGKLNAAKICGYVGVSKTRNLSLFNFLHKRHGLTFPVYLKGAEKKAGAALATRGYQKLQNPVVKNVLDQPILQSIYSRPEPYLYAFGITYDEVLESIKTTPT
jgi:Plasmid recombination enzyme